MRECVRVAVTVFVTEAVTDGLRLVDGVTVFERVTERVGVVLQVVVGVIELDIVNVILIVGVRELVRLAVTVGDTVLVSERVGERDRVKLTDSDGEPLGVRLGLLVLLIVSVGELVVDTVQMGDFEYDIVGLGLGVFDG